MTIGTVAHRGYDGDMTEVTIDDELEACATPGTAVDFGQALGALLRAYLDGARHVVSEIPGGPRGYQVMSVAAAGSCRNQAGIAEALGLDRTVMTHLVDALERDGLVERRPDPVDRRARQVVVTASGTAALDTAARGLETVERHVLAGLPDLDAETFRRLLHTATSHVPADPAGACSVADDAC